LRIVSWVQVLDVGIVRAIDSNLDSYGGRKVELGVQVASAVTRLDGLGGGELVDVVGAGCGRVEAGLNAFAFGLDVRVGQVDFGDDASHVEATSISNTAFIHSLQARTYERQTC